MRFPLRLTADLTLGLAAQALRGKTPRPLVFRFAPLEDDPRSPQSFHPIDSVQKSAAVLPADVSDSSAPIVWFAGADPLLHPHSARWTQELLRRGRHVFLPTEGNLLRRRIHEFQPVPRCSFVVEFNGMPDSHDLRAGRPGAFLASAEGIRVAKLSGFLTCAQTTIDDETTIDELQKLRERLQSLKVDGWVMVPASAGSNHRANLLRKLLEARQLIPSSRWRLFSELVETACAPRRNAEPARKLTPEPQSSREVCGESVQAP